MKNDGILPLSNIFYDPFNIVSHCKSFAYFSFTILLQEIDQWVTDAFYSYFPSLNESRKDKKLKLARDRQQDYNDYVKQIPQPVPKREQLRQKREQYLSQVKRSELTSASSIDGSSSPISSGARPGTPKHRLMQDLQHVDLPAMLQTDVIEQRERKSAEVSRISIFAYFANF